MFEYWKTPAWLAWIIALSLSTAAIIYGFDRNSDYEIFYRAGLRVLSGESVYQLADGLFPFKYHPIVAVGWALWAKLPLSVGKIIFLTLQQAIIWLSSLYWSRRLFPTSVPAALVALAALFGKCLVREAELGQINGLLLGMTTLAFAASQTAPILSLGLAFCAALVKLPYALLLLPLALNAGKLNLERLMAFIAIVVCIAIAATAIPSWRVMQSEWLSVLFHVSANQYTDQENQGIFHLACRLFPDFYTPVWATIVLLWSGIGLYIMRRDRISAYAWFLCGVNSLSPLAWRNQYILAAPLVLITFQKVKSIYRIAAFAPVALWQVFLQYDVIGRESYNTMLRNLSAFWVFVPPVVLFAVVHLHQDLAKVKSNRELTA